MEAIKITANTTTGYEAALKRKVSSGSTSSHGDGGRPYNHYNLYFILERELFLQERGVFPKEPAKVRGGVQRSDSTGSEVDYSDIDLPPLPIRYASLALPDGWYIHRKKKRAHVKTHGIISFREMATMVANRWKREDRDIVSYVKTVARSVKQRFDEANRLHNMSSASLLQEADAAMMKMSSASLLQREDSAPVMSKPPLSMPVITPTREREMYPKTGQMAFFPQDFPTFSNKRRDPTVAGYGLDSMTNPMIRDGFAACFPCGAGEDNLAAQDVLLQPPLPPLPNKSVEDFLSRRRSSVTSSANIAQLDLPDSEIIGMWMK